jgi:hypothetical protein
MALQDLRTGAAQARRTRLMLQCRGDA